MSEATTRANAFVAEHLTAATTLGRDLAELVGEPEAFAAALAEGLALLADPDYTALAERLSPGVPAELMVRGPLTEAVQRPINEALRESSSMTALHLGHRLILAPERSLRLFAVPCLRRALAEDPEQTWQLMRRMARNAGDWVEIDMLADVWARGVLAEPFRWAELEQLAYSERTYERRLVGATLATIPHRVPTARREGLRPEALERALELIRQLMGDAETMVQKALSWALREWTRVDRDVVAAFLQAETDIATGSRDGARAWVVRDSLSKQSAQQAASLREQLEGIRRDTKAPSTSIASTQAAAFAAALSISTDAVAAQGDRYTRSRA
jgi:3-methyladenine DNA glycosylase AlkD